MNRDTRRSLRRRANERGLTVKGLNGEIRPAAVIGGRHKERCPKVCVDDGFAPIHFPIGWSLVKAIADGHLTQIVIKPVPHLERLLGGLA